MHKHIVCTISLLMWVIVSNLQAVQLPINLTITEEDLFEQYFNKECYQEEKPAICSYIASQIESSTDYQKIFGLLRSADRLKTIHLASMKMDLIHFFENRILPAAINGTFEKERFSRYCPAKVVDLFFKIREQQCIELLISLVKPVDQWLISEKSKEKLLTAVAQLNQFDSIRCEAFYILVHKDKEFFNNNCHIIVKLAEYLKSTKDYPSIMILLDRQIKVLYGEEKEMIDPD